MTLGPQAGETYIDMDCFQIAIASGGSLTLDNPDLTLAGSHRMLQVQQGGSLALHRGRITAEDSVEGADTEVLFVSPGGALTRAEGFQIIGVVNDQSVEIAQPLDIVDLWCEEDPMNAGISLPVGCNLAQALPKQANAQVKLPDGTDQILRPLLEWDASGPIPRWRGGAR